MPENVYKPPRGLYTMYRNQISISFWGKTRTILTSDSAFCSQFIFISRKTPKPRIRSRFGIKKWIYVKVRVSKKMSLSSNGNSIRFWGSAGPILTATQHFVGNSFLFRRKFRNQESDHILVSKSGSK